MRLGSLWDLLVDGLCRPPRDSQYEAEDLVGGRRAVFAVGGVVGYRQDLTLVNQRGQQLACSHYKPMQAHGSPACMPCVVYAHCNSGSRRDAEEAVLLLIPLGISVFAFDFSGSGLSDGEWVTLGARESEDLSYVLDFLAASEQVSTIGLWGRSMGAVAALMCTAAQHRVVGMVLDSPFCRLRDLVEEVAVQMKLPVPRYMLRKLTGAMRRSVQKRAGFDINGVAPVDLAGSCQVPAIFGHGMEDTHIGSAHSQKLHSAYAGEKSILFFRGNHLTIRPRFFYRSVAAFFYNKLGAGLHLQQQPLSLACLDDLASMVTKMLEARITAADVDDEMLSAMFAAGARADITLSHHPKAYPPHGPLPDPLFKHLQHSPISGRASSTIPHFPACPPTPSSSLSTPIHHPRSHHPSAATPFPHIPSPSPEPSRPHPQPSYQAILDDLSFTEDETYEDTTPTASIPSQSLPPSSRADPASPCHHHPPLHPSPTPQAASPIPCHPKIARRPSSGQRAPSTDQPTNKLQASPKPSPLSSLASSSSKSRQWKVLSSVPTSEGKLLCEVSGKGAKRQYRWRVVAPNGTTISQHKEQPSLTSLLESINSDSTTTTTTTKEGTTSGSSFNPLYTSGSSFNPLYTAGSTCGEATHRSEGTTRSSAEGTLALQLDEGRWKGLNALLEEDPRGPPSPTASSTSSFRRPIHHHGGRRLSSRHRHRHQAAPNKPPRCAAPPSLGSSYPTLPASPPNPRSVLNPRVLPPTWTHTAPQAAAPPTIPTTPVLRPLITPSAAPPQPPPCAASTDPYHPHQPPTYNPNPYHPPTYQAAPEPTPSSTTYPPHPCHPLCNPTTINPRKSIPSYPTPFSLAAMSAAAKHPLPLSYHPPPIHPAPTQSHTQGHVTKAITHHRHSLHATTYALPHNTLTPTAKAHKAPSPRPSVFCFCLGAPPVDA